MSRTITEAKMYQIAVLGCVIYLAACTSAVPVKFMPYAGVSMYPPTDPASVMVLQNDPARPHNTLGHIIVEPDGRLSIEEAEQVLRDAAASIGADAVVVLANMPMQTDADSLQTSDFHLIAAVAIRYKEGGAVSLSDERAD